MEVIPKENRHLMPWALLVKPSGRPPQDLNTQWLFRLIVRLFLN